MSNPDNTQAIILKLEPLLAELSYYELSLLNRIVVERLKLMQKAGALASMSQFHVGDCVSWDGMDGIVHTGIIIRMNQKTVSVQTGDEGHWNVSPQLLRKEGGRRWGKE